MVRTPSLESLLHTHRLSGNADGWHAPLDYGARLKTGGAYQSVMREAVVGSNHDTLCHLALGVLKGRVR